MKTAALTTVAALLAAMTLAAPASAAKGPSTRTLARQIKALQKDVKTLKKQLRETQQIAALSLVYDACFTAATADAFQGTWETIDRAGAKFAPPFDQYAPQTAIADPLNACQRLEVARQPNVVPPTTDVFAALLNLFR